MYLIDCFTDLLHNEGNAWLGERLTLLELMVELPACPYFEEDVDVAGVVEAPIHLDNVRVVKEHLDLHLSNELVSNLLLVQKLFLNHLHCAYKASSLLSHQVHATVLARAQLFYSTKILHCYLARSLR